jgi:arylsulfatase A-like enzyme
VERQVELLDIPPTILDMVGIPIPAEFEGQSFVSLFSAGSATPYDKRYALSAVAETRNYGDAKQSVRTSKWKYIFHPASGREELYDLERDPGEDDNVVDAHRDVAAKLRTFLQDPSLIEKLESPTAPMVGPEDREILKELGYIE